MRQSCLSLVLLPLSYLLRVIICLRRGILVRRYQPYAVAMPPVVVVGNIVLGGSGKTPMIGWLVSQLQAKQLAVAVVCKGYGASCLAGDKNRVVTVEIGHTADAVGDEPLMLKQQFPSLPVVISSNRLLAVTHIKATMRVDVIISDDGMQNYRMPRQMEIVMVDGAIRFGNGHVFPAGPLREPVQRLRGVDWVVHTHNASSLTDRITSDKQANGYVVLSIRPVHWRNLSTGEIRNIHYFVGQQVYAVAGIGNPERFFSSCELLGLKIERRAFDDHHQFVAEDFAEWDKSRPVIMTAKDAVKCQSMCQNVGQDSHQNPSPNCDPTNWWEMCIEPTLDPADGERIVSAIQRLMVQ